MTDSSELLIEKREGVDWVTLNRPQRRNALNGGLLDALHSYFERVRRDEAVRVIVLRGSGTGFCSGVDAKDYTDPETPPMETWKLGDCVRLIHEGPQPVIALINGPAMGAGFAIAAAADVRIAAASAWMQANFTHLGLGGAELGLSYFLPPSLGHSVARELVMTARRFPADRALATGFVSEVVPDEALNQAGTHMAAEMMALTPIGLRTTKQTMNAATLGNLEAAIEFERRGQLLCAQGTLATRFGELADQLSNRTKK